MSFEDLIERHPGKSYLLAAALLVMGIEPFTENQTRKNLVEKVEHVIDVNHDNRITYEEWHPVYKELNLRNLGEKGKDLSIGQLEKYLDNHGGWK